VTTNKEGQGDPVLPPEEYRKGAERIATDVNQKVLAMKRILATKSDDTTDVFVLLEEIETLMNQLLNPPN